MVSEGNGGREDYTHFLEVHATHSTHSTHSGHAASAATKSAHTDVFFIHRRPFDFLLILINPLGKVGLDILALNLVLREAGPIIEFKILFTKR